MGFLYLFVFFTHFFFHFQGWRVDGAYFQQLLSKRLGKILDRSPLPGLIDNQLFTLSLTLSEDLQWPNNLTAWFGVLGGISVWKKKQKHKWMNRACKLHPEKLGCKPMILFRTLLALLWILLHPDLYFKF